MNTRERFTLWLTEPRASLAYAVSNLGAAVSRLGNRIHDEAPGDYSQGQLDGQQIATIYAAVTTDARREEVRRLLSAVDLPSDDDALERLGWKATA